MSPVAGLLTPRDFLNFLAFRVFPSTQYIRHQFSPMFTPEPDIIHETIGHAPLLAHRDFADLSQKIGIASLGASDEVIRKLAACYWFSIEFGIIWGKGGGKKIYGAAFCSSSAETINAISDAPEFRHFEPEAICDLHYPIDDMQTMYCWSNSIQEAKNKVDLLLRHFG